MKKILLVTTGDPNGVGPEICVRAMDGRRTKSATIPVLMGDPAVLLAAHELLEAKRPLILMEDLSEAERAWRDGIPVYCPEIYLGTRIKPGKVDVKAGAYSIALVRKAVELCLAGEAAGMVTAPICKEAVEPGIAGFQGHTEFIGEMCGDPQPVLALWHDKWAVGHVSTHVSLREAVERVKKPRILKTIRLLHEFLVRTTGKPAPRIGVAGLNPHAGEGGLFGDEEIKHIAPAVKQAIKNGIAAQGPLPGDVVFPMLKAGRFDGVVAMYHDQGHVVTKSLFFDLGSKAVLRGVNVTLGLPVVRTSVDHGTGFDMAWQGTAACGSLLDAIRLADALVA